MIFYSLAIFAFAALGGLFLAFRHFTKKSLPMPVALLHGAGAAAGLVCLGLGLSAGGQMALISLIVLIVAALGGVFLFSFHLRGKPLPSAVVVIHAFAAVVGVAIIASVVGRAV